MWARRLFYDTNSGDIVRMWCAKGSIRLLAQDEEAALCGLTNHACMEWTKPDAEIEAAFEPMDADGNPRIVNVSVDVSGAEPQLVFEYAAVPEQEQSESEDMAAALALLGVTPEVDNA